MDSSEIRQALIAAQRKDSAASSDFDLNPHVELTHGRILRDAAVLVLFQADAQAGARLVLTKRSSALRHHPGQIACPGGKIEALDGGPEGAALREAREEIGLPDGAAELLGALPAHETVTGFTVTPILAWLPRAVPLRPEPGEVAEIFSVPWTHAADPARFRVEERIWRGTMRRYYVAPFGPYYIWGATARILRGLAGRLSQ
ncbi:CoA pyrophosphatase [Mesobaculum littorinae]|uniref:CoA pyrophosphatase n=1 Tax=Mesobaculum littorinae TaxID=2486419 RepID=A0A438AHG9_9RHOB|nr:CoA pyrophosphatase [Mesobaculum littorinae]RVV98037.1 CoA pyrophosphatase [Mesobaculum littorinae]